MKLKTKQFAIAMAAALDLMSGAALGEDIDLYGGTTTANAPNVLLFLDNTSNWSASSQQWTKAGVWAKCGSDTTCQSYVTQVFGSATGLQQGQVELRAIKLVLNELACNATTPLNVNIGLMLFNNSAGTAEAKNTGGYIRRAIKPLLDSTQSPTPHCAALIGDLNLIDSQITAPDFKTSSSADYGAALYEAFKYYGGYANPTQAQQDVGGTPTDSTHFGTAPYVTLNGFEDMGAFTNAGKNNYQSPISATNSCGKNYLVLVGNTWPNQEYGTNPNVNPPTNTLMTRLAYSPTQIYSTSKSNIRFGDEWTRFLASTDVSDQSGQQPVFTYTLNVYNASADANQTTLLKSMARVGGTGASGYREVDGNIKKLVDAFKDILTQIAAVNSVFASASLPVSVNTQGTYLNQVFIGMFRPEGTARPRWAGNLKQYQFSYDAASQSLFLADADKSAAIDNANTGFITACARSFWTTDTGTYWQDIPPSQTPPGACLTSGTSVYSDSPDGNLVEKGAAAQQLRQISGVANRGVKTCSGTSTCGSSADVVAFDTTNMSSTELGVVDNAARDTLVSWVRGQNVGDGPSPDGITYETYNKPTTATDELRPTVHGDVVHSRPLVINYGNGTTNDVVVFYGAGDGMLHAADGNQTGSGPGQELWSFIAPEFWTRLSRLRENTPLIAFPSVPLASTPTPTKKDYFFDGAIGAYQERDSSGIVSKVHLYPSMRRGGRMVYGFDATSKPSPSDPLTMPSLLWRFGCPNLTDDTACVGGTDAAKLGQTWSTPRVIVTKDGDSDPSNNTLYLTFGGGYDTCEDAATPTCSGTTKGLGVFILDAVTGVQDEFIDLAASGAGRVIADIVPVDVNADNYTDVLYAADTRGNLWRINTSDPDAGYVGYLPSDWSDHTYLVASVSDWSAQVSSRKFSYAPDVVTLGGINVVLLGTGDREQPLNGSFATGVRNRFYAFRDEYAKAVVSTVSDPSTEVSVVTSSEANSDTAADITTCSGCLLNVTDTTLNYSTAVLGGKGWFIDLAVTLNPLEQVVTTPVTVGGATYFSTFQADDLSTASCSNLGTGRGYAVNFLTGGLRSGDTLRQEDFTGGGIPPSPVAGVVEIGKDKVPFCLGCKPPDGGGSSLEGTRVEIPIVQRRNKVYRVRQIDE